VNQLRVIVSIPDQIRLGDLFGGEPRVCVAASIAKILAVKATCLFVALKSDNQKRSATERRRVNCTLNNEASTINRQAI